MAEPMTAERLAELRRLVAGYAETADRDWNCKGCGQLDTRCRCAEEFFSDRDALLRAADERDKARADLHALRTALVEATMEPFDIGPCYIAGPLPLKQKHDGEAFAVQHERLLGVFGQLLDRVEAKASGTTEACNRVWRERDRLRAQRDRLRAERDALVAVLEQCDVFLRVHAKPDNELKTAVQAAIRAAKENQ